MRDIETRSDLEGLLTLFYQQVFTDPVISHFFTTVLPLDLNHHLPLIADFWEAVLFGRHTYSKNVMAVHQHLNSLSPIQAQHLDQWLLLFTTTVDQHFSGERAELMKQRAQSIATLMKIKIANPTITRL